MFATANGKVLHKNRIHHLLKEAARRAGFEPADFTSQSLRAGGASAMYHKGFSAEDIQRRGRWVSDVWKVYIQGNSDGAATMTRRMSTNATVIHDRLKGAWTARRQVYGWAERRCHFRQRRMKWVSNHCHLSQL